MLIRFQAVLGADLPLKALPSPGVGCGCVDVKPTRIGFWGPLYYNYNCNKEPQNGKCWGFGDFVKDVGPRAWNTWGFGVTRGLLGCYRGPKT